MPNSGTEKKITTKMHSICKKDIKKKNNNKNDIFFFL